MNHLIEQHTDIALSGDNVTVTTTEPDVLLISVMPHNARRIRSILGFGFFFFLLVSIGTLLWGNLSGTAAWFFPTWALVFCIILYGGARDWTGNEELRLDMDTVSIRTALWGTERWRECRLSAIEDLRIRVASRNPVTSMARVNMQQSLNVIEWRDERGKRFRFGNHLNETDCARIHTLMQERISMRTRL